MNFIQAKLLGFFFKSNDISGTCCLLSISYNILDTNCMYVFEKVFGSILSKQTLNAHPLKLTILIAKKVATLHVIEKTGVDCLSYFFLVSTT